jgi:hypothetical protein
MTYVRKVRSPPLEDVLTSSNSDAYCSVLDLSGMNCSFLDAKGREEPDVSFSKNCFIQFPDTLQIAAGVLILSASCTVSLISPEPFNYCLSSIDNARLARERTSRLKSPELDWLKEGNIMK